MTIILAIFKYSFKSMQCMYFWNIFFHNNAHLYLRPHVYKHVHVADLNHVDPEQNKASCRVDFKNTCEYGNKIRDDSSQSPNG